LKVESSSIIIIIIIIIIINYPLCLIYLMFNV
jgi:hypothetical protein